MLPWLGLGILLFSSCVFTAKKVEHDVLALGNLELKQNDVAFDRIINDLPCEFEPSSCQEWNTSMAHLPKKIWDKYIKIFEPGKSTQYKHTACLWDAFQAEIIDSLTKQFNDLRLDLHHSGDNDFDLLTQLRITHEIIELITKDNDIEEKQQTILSKGVEEETINIDIHKLWEQDILEI